MKQIIYRIIYINYILAMRFYIFYRCEEMKHTLFILYNERKKDRNNVFIGCYLLYYYFSQAFGPSELKQSHALKVHNATNYQIT